MPAPDIAWRLHLAAAPSAVFARLATAEGRASFWAESAPERDGHVEFTFVDGTTLRAAILRREPPTCFVVRYFGGCVVTFRLTPDASGGTELALEVHAVPAAQRAEDAAGWVSVLLALRAAVDFGVDLRHHDPHRSWSRGYVDG